MNNNLSRISFIVHQKKIFNVSDNLIIGISGGQDSIVLLLLIYHLKNPYKLKLNLVYCNHLWQKKNFYALFELLKIAYTLNLPINHIIGKTEIQSEEEGHFWRQKNFFQVGNYFDIPFIVLGHSATDQIETALWHFLRGTSPQGLTSLKIINSFQVNTFANKISKLNFYNKKLSKQKFILKKIISSASKTYFYQSQGSNATFVRSTQGSTQNQYKFVSPNVLNQKKFCITRNFFYLKKYFILETSYYAYNISPKIQQNYKLQRPLLDFYRSSITTLINQNHLPFIHDITNQSKKIIRNKIRLILMPLFHYYIQTKSEIHIKNFINITNIEQKYLNGLSLTIMESYINNPKLINSLIYTPAGVQRLCIKKILEKYTLKQIKICYIEEIYQSVQKQIV